MRIQGSIDSVRSLNAGRCLVAGFHVPALSGAAPIVRQGPEAAPASRLAQADRLLAPDPGPDDAQRACRPCARWPTSRDRRCASSTGRSAPALACSWTTCCTNGLDAGSLCGIREPVEETHVAVAACIASGVADVGLGVEAAALEFGLHFLPDLGKTTSSRASSPTWSTRRCCGCGSFWRAMPGRAFSSRSPAIPARVRRAPSSA